MVEELGKEELEEYLEKIEDMLENDDMIEKMAPEVLAEYDKNKDGVLQLDECTKFMTTVYEKFGCGKPKPQRVVDIFNQKDSNKNGTLELEEVKGLVKSMLKFTKEEITDALDAL